MFFKAPLTSPAKPVELKATMLLAGQIGLTLHCLKLTNNDWLIRDE